jgi:hypothetical protein
METANAFDMLVLPVLQWFAGIVATFPILHGIRVGLGRLFSESKSGEDSR